MALILLGVADVVFHLAASISSQESPTHPSNGTESDVFGWLFWVGVAPLVVLGVAAVVRSGFLRRFVEMYVYSTPGLADGVADVQIGAASDEWAES